MTDTPKLDALRNRYVAQTIWRYDKNGNAYGDQIVWCFEDVLSQRLPEEAPRD